MFSDSRSKRVILVSHCIFNQNTKIDRCACYPGAMKETAQLLIESGAGILQMPCPELLTLGLDRRVDPLHQGSIEAEDDRVAEEMNLEEAGTVCHRIAQELIYQIRQYRQHGFRVIGVLGINGSPTCGVECGWSAGVEKAGPGILIRTLAEECAKDGISLPMRGIKAREPEKAVEITHQLIDKL